MTTQAINGHVVDYISHRFECLNCGARLLSIMQFQTRECPKPQIPAARPAGEGRESEALASAAPICDHYYAWVSPAGARGSARICMTCHQPDPEWLNHIVELDHGHDDCVPCEFGTRYISPAEHERLVREARVEALEQAADEWRVGILGAQWLRDRAAQHRADKEPT